MKMKSKIMIAALLSALFVLTLLGTAVAAPVGVVKINAVLSTEDPNMPPGEKLMLEVLAKGGDESLAGSGSGHGTKCHATFFFEGLNGDIADDMISLEGTIGRTNEATVFGYHGFFEGWVGTPVAITVDLSDNSVTCDIAGIIFTGQGIIVQ